MASENVEAKGRRYLTEGRVVVERIDGALVQARVRGNGAVYQVAFDRDGWSCSCLARGRCSHLVAVQLVTAPAEKAA